MNATEIYFVHGWGCDGTVWHKWLPAINKNATYQIFDRGYGEIDGENISLSNTTSFKVLIAHSLGLHFIPLEFFQRINVLVLISSFRHFHEKSLKGRLSEQRISWMRRRLMTDPQALLQDFYSNCGWKQAKLPHPDKIDRQLLCDDLTFLDKNQIDLAALQEIPLILLLHGARDQIVSAEHSQLMHKLLPNSKLFVHEQAEHALPLTHASWCMDIINDQQKNSSDKIFSSPDTTNKLVSSAITTNFAKRANSYEQAARMQKIAADRLASRITSQAKYLSPDDSILEIGCGSGLLSRHLLKLFPEHTIYFLDPAKDMLELCRQNVGTGPAQEFIHSTIEDHVFDSEFSQKKHTLIASSFVLHWLFDLKLVLNRLLENLAPAGQIFFSFPAAGSFPQWQTICRQLNIPFTGNQLPGLEDIQSAVDSNKATIDCEEYTYQIDFRNSMQFFRHMKMLGANTKKFIPARELTITDFRSLLKTWDSQSMIELGKRNNSVNCTYKILEGTITRR